MKKYIVFTVILVSFFLIYNQRFLKNPALVHSVSHQLNMEETILVPKKEMEQLTELHASWWNDADLDGVRYGRNIETLYFAGNGVKDISRLENLPNLKEIHLADNDINDISVLSHMEELTLLDLRYNEISDISPIGQVTFKGEDGGLDLSHNDISSLSSLSTTVFEDDFSYFYLAVNNNNLTNLEGIQSFYGTTELVASNNKLNDISAISSLKGLRYLNISYNDIENLIVLEDVHPVTLIASNNKLKSLSGINVSPDEPYYLDFSTNDLRSVEELEGITEGDINLDNNRIKDLSPLKSLQNGKLSIKGNKLTAPSHKLLQTLSQRGVIIEHDLLPVREMEMGVLSGN